MWIKLDIINTKSIYYNGINVLKQVYRFIINIQIQKIKNVNQVKYNTHKYNLRLSRQIREKNCGKSES